MGNIIELTLQQCMQCRRRMWQRQRQMLISNCINADKVSIT